MIELQDQTCKLISCVMENMADEAIEILRAGNFNKDILNDVDGFTVPLPLHMITKLNNILLCDVDSWSEWFRPTIRQMYRECMKLMRFWETEYGYTMTSDIDFSPYEEYCRHFDDGWDYEMLFDANLDTLLTLGYTENECEFCHAVIIYKHDLIQKHLALGTPADVNIGNRPHNEKEDGKYIDDAYNVLAVCNTAYSDSYDVHGLARFIHAGYDKKLIKVEWGDLQELLRAGAYTQLERQIKANLKK